MSAAARSCVDTVSVRGCALERVLHAGTHVRGDKRMLDVSRGEGLWNMESSRVVLRVTPVLETRVKQGIGNSPEVIAWGRRVDEG